MKGVIVCVPVNIVFICKVLECHEAQRVANELPADDFDSGREGRFRHACHSFLKFFHLIKPRVPDERLFGFFGRRSDIVSDQNKKRDIKSRNKQSKTE